MALEKFSVRTAEGSHDSSHALSVALKNWLETFGPVGIMKNCGNCRHMRRGPEPAHCMKYDMVPPIEIIMRGCPSYEDESDVPF